MTIYFDKNQQQNNKYSKLRRSIGIWHSFDAVSMIVNVHNRHSGYFPNALPKIAITSGNNIAFMLKVKIKQILKSAYLGNSLDYTIISISSFMRTTKTFEAVVLDNLKCQFETLAHLFQFAQYTIGNVRYNQNWILHNLKVTFSIQAIHKSGHHINLILDREIDKVRIDNHVKWWSQLCIILQKQCRRDSRPRLTVKKNDEKLTLQQSSSLDHPAFSFGIHDPLFY